MEATTETKKISYEEFLDQYGEEGAYAEWVDGDVIMAPPVSERHQDIGRFILNILSFYVESRVPGKVFYAPYQMRLEFSSREPDVFFVAASHLDRVKDNYLDGPADMVVEIISKESQNRDRGDKFFEYESAGIPEYWLIDPIRNQAEFYRLDAQNHYCYVPLDADGVFHSEVLPGFWLKVSWVWQEPLPSIWDVLREWRLL